MAGQKFTLTFDANLNVSQMKGALADIQKGLNNLNLRKILLKGYKILLIDYLKKFRILKF